ncbi:hypothetical protein VTL71DRAFT_11355 [Oculimacula yallundae]|uniref:Heterokaryon incompatibility domain-containing protein n=1 Tax=Oculimacula yallundae TaxID=86028 RepID=A0ABR4CQC9_9HELO
MASKRQQSFPSSHRKSRKSNRTTQLCSQCSDVDFTGLFQPPTLGREIALAEHTFIIGSQRDACAFCSFLLSMGPFDISGDRNIYLQVSHADARSFPLLTSSGGILMAIKCQGSFRDIRYFISQPDPENPVRLIQPNDIDYRIIKDWLQICQELHCRGCKTTGIKVPGLRLIDCKTRALVPASDHIYITLSYLWGRDEDETPYTCQLPAELPMTIEDAISVTLQLGFRYLWIDRYCIDQQNKIETLAQLKAMGLIYRNSQLTIIATAGEGPSFGLPGVGKQASPRSQQAHTKIGQAYLRGLQRIDHLVLPSSWNSRGWTYQEGILATRRLVFTSSEVYFECQGMSSYESLNLPYRTMHNYRDDPNAWPLNPKGDQRLSDCYFATTPGRLGARLGLFPLRAGGRPQDLYIHIARYSAKNLSYDSDRLRAFLGILNAFETGKHAVKNIWGIPVLSTPRPGASTRTRSSELVYSVSTFVLGLMWDLEFRDEAVRIEGLPSWSWVGVRGAVEIDYRLRTGDCLKEGMMEIFNLKVDMEVMSGELVDWDAWQKGYMSTGEGTDGFGRSLSPFIHIEAWSAPARIITRSRAITQTESRNNIETEGEDESQSEEIAGKSFSDQYRTLSIEMKDASFVRHEIFIPNSFLVNKPSCASRSAADAEHRSDIEAEVEDEVQVTVLILGQLSGQLCILVIRRTQDESFLHGNYHSGMWERVQKLFAGRGDGSMEC